MRMIPLSSDITAMQNVLLIRAFMLFPEDQEKRISFLEATNALTALTRLRETAPDDGNMTVSCRLFDAGEAGLKFLTQAKTEIERQEDIGKRAGSMAVNLLYLSNYYRSGGGKKSPSLTEVNDLMIGWAAEYQNENGVNLGHNRASLNEAWQQYGSVAHFWMAEILLEGAISKGLINSSSDDEEIAKRLNVFLAAAKYTLQTLVNIVPHGRKEPVVNVSQLYWLIPEMDVYVAPFEQIPPSYDKAELKSMRDFVTRYKGAKAIGKKRQREKIAS